MSDDTLRASFFAEAIPNFRLPKKYLPPRPLPLTKSHISPISAFLSKLKPSLLACSATSLSATLLHATRPRLSRQVIHTNPHPPPPSTSHMPRPPARARHLPPKSLPPPPNKHRHSCRPPDLGGAPCHLLATPVKHARFTQCVCCSCISFTNSSELCYLILPCNLLL